MRFCRHSSTFDQQRVDLKKHNMKAVQFAFIVCAVSFLNFKYNLAMSKDTCNCLKNMRKTLFISKLAYVSKTLPSCSVKECAIMMYAMHALFCAQMKIRSYYLIHKL